MTMVTAALASLAAVPLAAHLASAGPEVFMNNVWLDAGFAIAVVPWPEVASPMKSPMKSDKRGGAIAGLKADNAMMADIFKTIPPVAALGQIRAMRARRI